MYARLAYRYGLTRAELIVCQNAYQAMHIGREFGPKHVHTQHNVYLSAPRSDALRSRSERAYIAWLGVFREPKNLPLLCQTARRLPSIEFRVAGMPAADVNSETARGLEGLRQLSNVRLVGYLKRTEVPYFLGAATALLCTSHYEGFSNTFLEALAMGTPIVTRNGVDPDSIIARFALGRVAENDDRLPDCVREVDGLAGDDFNRLAQRCRHYVETNHAPAPIMQSFVDAVRPLVPASKNR